MDAEDMPDTADMTESKERIAVEDHARALAILEDALKKKDRLLLDMEIESIEKKKLDPRCPFLHRQLVSDLYHKLQKVKFLKREVSSVPFYLVSSTTIVLCQAFWDRKEYLAQRSRPGALILAAAQFLGYTQYVWDQNDDGTLTASDICNAFETWMNHDGVYENGVYTCCGEKERDSVCEESRMSRSLLPYMNESDERDLKKATLDVLLDSQKKGLLMEHIEDTQTLQNLSMFPIITITLVDKFISKLKVVKFKCDKTDNIKIAYTNPKSRNIIFVCRLFWYEKDYLCRGSCLGTVILHIAEMLGYQHLLGVLKQQNLPTSSVNTSRSKVAYNITPMCSSRSDIGDCCFSRRSETSGNDEITADSICAAFEIGMSHKGDYENGSYTCCMETARHSVCEKSIMKECLDNINLFHHARQDEPT